MHQWRVGIQVGDALRQLTLKRRATPRPLERGIRNEPLFVKEVAQKIVKSGGRDYGYTSLFFQHYFTWKLLDKVPPGAFFPPPKVFSRLIYFSPKKEVAEIKNTTGKACFGRAPGRQARRRSSGPRCPTSSANSAAAGSTARRRRLPNGQDHRR